MSEAMKNPRVHHLRRLVSGELGGCALGSFKHTKKYIEHSIAIIGTISSLTVLSVLNIQKIH